MKTKISLAVLVTLFTLSCGQNKPETSPTQTSEQEVAGVSQESSDYSEALAGFTKELNGIEYYFVKLSDGDPEEIAGKLHMLYTYKEQTVPFEVQEIINSKEYSVFPYIVAELDTKNGYLELNCTQCENTKFMTYWNVSDGSKLIATVDRGCGPVCSDDVRFFSVKENKIETLENETVLEEIALKDFLVDETKAASLGEDPAEIGYHLPKTGKNIKVRLEGASDKEIFKGNTLELIWNDGKFKKGNYTFE